MEFQSFVISPLKRYSDKRSDSTCTFSDETLFSYILKKLPSSSLYDTKNEKKGRVGGEEGIKVQEL